MPRTTNTLMLAGVVGRPPEVVERDGERVAHFSLATCRDPQDRAGECKRTDWHRLEARDRWVDLVVDSLDAGDRVYVEGQLQYDSYERDGVTVPTATVAVQELVLLTSLISDPEED